MITEGARIRIKLPQGVDPQAVAAEMNHCERFYWLSTSGGGWVPRVPKWTVLDGEVVLPRHAPSILSGQNILYWLHNRCSVAGAVVIFPTVKMNIEQECDEITHADGFVVFLPWSAPPRDARSRDIETHMQRLTALQSERRPRLPQ